MGFTVEGKHLIKRLRVSSSHEYLTLTSMECLIPHRHTLKILCKSRHFHRRYKRKCELVFFLNTVYFPVASVSVAPLSVCDLEYKSNVLGLTVLDVWEAVKF